MLRTYEKKYEKIKFWDVLFRIIVSGSMLWFAYNLSFLFSAMFFVNGFILFTLGGIHAILMGLIITTLIWEIVEGTIKALVKKDINVFYEFNLIKGLFLSKDTTDGKRTTFAIIYFLFFGILAAVIGFVIYTYALPTYSETFNILNGQINTVMLITSIAVIVMNTLFELRKDIFTLERKRTIFIIVMVILVICGFVGFIRAFTIGL